VPVQCMPLHSNAAHAAEVPRGQGQRLNPGLEPGLADNADC